MNQPVMIMGFVPFVSWRGRCFWGWQPVAGFGFGAAEAAWRRTM